MLALGVAVGILLRLLRGRGVRGFCEVDVSMRWCAVAGALMSLAVPAAGGAQARRFPPRAPAPQIIGGEPVRGGSGVMAFVINDLGAGKDELCTGTVLSSNVVLTAGHCADSASTGVPYPAGRFTVITGALDWSTPVGRQVSGVSQVIVNPGYDPATNHDDAGLLVLSTPTTAPAIALATQPGDASLLVPGTPAVTAGWGQTTPDGAASTALQQAGTVIQSAGFCATGAAAVGVVRFDPGIQLCTIDAPSDTTGTCNGDSGGPLLAEQDGAPVELGIVSFGACVPTQASFMTRADAIAAWAQSEVAAVAPPPPVPVAAPTPAPVPPVATGSAGLPRAGTYRGRSSQRLAVTLRVTTGRRALSGARFRLRLRCANGRRREISLRPLRGGHWALQTRAGLGFAHARHGAGHERYRISGRFTTAGSAAGTVTATLYGRRWAVCSSGTVRWTARLAG